MRTSKPFSTISYNSQDFLQQTLSDLVKRRKIAFFAFVEHLPEEDEKKAHKHVFIVPNGLVDTDQVIDTLKEIDLANPLKPLGCIPPNSSKFDDWYLYSLHDAPYLASKGQSRKYHYALQDFHVSDEDYMTHQIHSIDYSRYQRFQRLVEAVDDGETFPDLVRKGLIPIQQITAYERAYDLMAYASVWRADHTTHTPKEKK